MKNRTTLAALALALAIVNAQLSTAHAQGSLTPPGAPAPTMKTLTQIEPRTPISSLPYTITNPGSYYVTTNLTSSGSGNGITVSSGNVTIDLNGFVLRGVPGSGDGVYVSLTITNLVIRNGTVTRWGSHGIDAWNGGYPRNMLFEKLTVSANSQNGIYTEAGSIIRDCIAIGNGASGFNSAGGEITGCVSGNNTAGFTVNYCSLIHCSADHNANDGIDLNYSRALDCDSLYNSGYAISCTGTGNEIRRCRAMGSNTGIYFGLGSGANVVDSCEIANNPYGIYIYGGIGSSYIANNNLSQNTAGGIILNDGNNYLENNHVVTPNGVEGIGSAGFTNNVVVKNVVIGGGSAAVNYGVDNLSDLGPVGSAATATSPWANISH